jgi:hypothetical protein
MSVMAMLQQLSWATRYGVFPKCRFCRPTCLKVPRYEAMSTVGVSPRFLTLWRGATRSSIPKPRSRMDAEGVRRTAGASLLAADAGELATSH